VYIATLVDLVDRVLSGYKVTVYGVFGLPSACYILFAALTGSPSIMEV
jgi:hypothetical protein